ncbi:MAG: hypothetical protein ACP5HM_05785 [Anaerolineae bacterium]
MEKQPEITTLAETEMYEVFVVEGEDGDRTYHLEIGNVTINFLPEDWEEFLDLMTQLLQR